MKAPSIDNCNRCGNSMTILEGHVVTMRVPVMRVDWYLCPICNGKTEVRSEMVDVFDGKSILSVIGIEHQEKSGDLKRFYLSAPDVYDDHRLRRVDCCTGRVFDEWEPVTDRPAPGDGS